MRHDRHEVIEKATNLFWEKGFHATSMRGLQEAVDMCPGSIYASFGSKEGLFKEVLRHYSEINLRQLTALVEAAPSPLEGVKDAGATPHVPQAARLLSAPNGRVISSRPWENGQKKFQL